MLLTIYYNKIHLREAHVTVCDVGYFVQLYEGNFLVFNKGFFYEFPQSYAEQYAYDFVSKRILG